MFVCVCVCVCVCGQLAFLFFMTTKRKQQHTPKKQNPRGAAARSVAKKAEKDAALAAKALATEEARLENAGGADGEGGADAARRDAKKETKKDPDSHPYARSSIIEVLYSDGSLRMCDIVERSQTSDDAWRYYVHYHDFNRRMDEWVTVDRVRSPPSVATAKFKKEEGERKRREKEAALLLEKKNREAMERRERELEERGEQRRRTRRGTSGAASPRAAEEEDDGMVNTVAVAEIDEHEGMDEASLREHEEVTKVKNVETIEMGKYRMDCWYFSPFPPHIFSSTIDILYICEYTFNFYTCKSALLRDQSKPGRLRHPPGNEIYRRGNLSMFEIDGNLERQYCQNLCYIAKLFLDHKTLYYDVDPFLFYVLCECDDRGYHPVGYYSKEKYSDVGYNLACILTFPCHQRKGYGRFLISFSYELSKKEEKVGSPEKPMSDLGQQAYKPYWTSTILDYLVKKEDRTEISIMEISKETSIMAEDIIFSLNQVGILKFIHGSYFIACEPGVLQDLASKHPIKTPLVDPNCLHWTPYLTDVKRDKFSIHNKRPTYGDGGSNSIKVTGEFGGGRGGGSGAMGRAT